VLVQNALALKQFLVTFYAHWDGHAAILAWRIVNTKRHLALLLKADFA
jgi:hypothetical protein